MGAGAIAVAVGPLIGGFATTYFSWRWVFVGEVVLVAGILVLARRIADTAPEERVPFDFVGAVLTALGLGLAVFGILQSSEWGWVRPKPDGPSMLGLSPDDLADSRRHWSSCGYSWSGSRLEARGGEPLVRPRCWPTGRSRGGLLMFFLLYLVQAGLFFTIPLFLSVALGLSALETGSGSCRCRSRCSPPRSAFPVLPECVAAPGGPAGSVRDARRASSSCSSPSTPAADARDRDRAAAARRAGYRRAGLATRRGDSVGGARRGQR